MYDLLRSLVWVWYKVWKLFFVILIIKKIFVNFKGIFSVLILGLDIYWNGFNKSNGFLIFFCFML